MARWEVEDEDWAEIRDQLCAKLVEVARSRDLISYGKLVRVSPKLEGPQSHAFHEMLGEIGATCRAQGLPLLSALATYQEQADGPGPGFYAAAERLGYSVGKSRQAQFEFWWREVQKCHAEWVA